MHGFAPLSCFMQPAEEIFQRFLKCLGGRFVSTVLMLASCFCKYYFSWNQNFQQINSITKQLGQHLHCSICCIGCGSMLMKSAVIRKEITNKMQQYIKIYYSMFIWSSTCFGQHTAHHQELKTSLAASRFAYLKGVRRWGCWTLSKSNTFHIYKTRGC